MTQALGDNVEDFYGLTPTQAGILFHSLHEHNTYIAQVEVDLGDVDPRAFVEAVSLIVATHPALRTRYRWEGLPEPVQVVDRSIELPVRIVDWVPDEMTDSDLRRLLEEERAAVSLAHGGLLRFLLLREAGRIRRVVATRHHIILDQWSSDIVIDDLIRAYLAEVEGGTPQLRRPRPFRDFLQWLHGQPMDEAEAHWRELLAAFDTPADLQLPTGTPGAGFGAEEIVIDPSDVEELRAVARRRGLTLNTTVCGAWAIVLSRFAGSTDVVFGTAVSGRPESLEGVEGMVGLFITSIPVRVEVRGGVDVTTLLSSIQASLAASQPYEHLALADIQRCSAVPPGRQLFDTMVAFEHASAGAGDLSMPRSVHSTEATNFQMTLIGSDRREGLRLTMFHDRSRVSPEAVRRLLASVRQALHDIAVHPDGPVSGVLRPESSLARITGRDLASPRETLVSLVEAQVDRTPDALAVHAGGADLTYRELDARANQIARALLERGVSAGDRVAVGLERGIELVVAVLGILKSGAGYLPLDPSLPLRRRQRMVEAAGARIVVAGPDAHDLVPGGPVVEPDSPGVAAADASRLGLPLSDRSLAYVMFTSGSTGLPKGVMIEHEQVVELVRWLQTLAPIGARDRVLLHTSIGFDLSAQEIFWALATGASVVAAPAAVHYDPQVVLETIADERVSTMVAVPSALGAMLDVADAADTDLDRLRLVLLAGEAVAGDLVDRVLSRSRAAIKNLYGPTETHCVTGCDVTALEPTEPAHIGWARPGSAAYVLDGDLQPVPDGVAGEVFLAGSCVGRGYIGRPGLTADRFLPDPFASRPGGRMYRTGDGGRIRSDGAIEFLGRLDHQVKIRGHRIEPGEIEVALVGHPDVDHAVVVARDLPGGLALVAFVASSTGVSVPEVRGFLAQLLPSYMVPAVITELPELPLNANGKVDRAALPAVVVAPATERDHVAPSTEVETVLAAVWAEVLGVERIGVDDEFLAVGGDSLSCLRIVARATEAGFAIRPRDVFEAATVGALARRVQPAREDEPAPVLGPVGLTPAQLGFLGSRPRDPHHFNSSTMLHVAPEIDLGALAAAVDALGAHHEALRLRIDGLDGLDGEGRARIVDQDDGRVALETIDVADSEIEATAAAVQPTLDLTRGPTARFVALRVDGAPARLLLVIHHLAVDALSLRVLVEDLVHGYDQAARGAKVRLPARTASFGRCAEVLATRARSDEVAAHAPFWASVSQDIAPVPVDHPNGANTWGAIRRIDRQVPLGLELARRLQAAGIDSAEDVVLAALATVLSRWTGHDPVVIAMQHNGRDELASVDASRTVGFFRVKYPLRLHIDSEAPEWTTLASVVTQRREVRGRAASYEQLQWLGPPEVRRSLAAPVPDVLFNFLGRFDEPWSGPPWLGLAPESCGSLRPPDTPRPHPLAVLCHMRDSQLHIRWEHDGRHDRGTIADLATRHARSVRQLLASVGNQSATLTSFG